MPSLGSPSAHPDTAPNISSRINVKEQPSSTQVTQLNIFTASLSRLAAMASTFLRSIGALSPAFLAQFPFFSNSSSMSSALGPSLSTGAQIYLRDTPGYAEPSLRWSAAQSPDLQAIIRVTTEADVQHTIRYANKYNHPFLAISGGHGQTSTLSNVKNGIGIYMRALDGIQIVDNGTAALIDGGVMNGNLIRTLWNHGKQTVTTGCDCVGFISPVLGGGHGWLQGRYGLPADNLLSARMVLANGTGITVSDSEHTELFWGIRGAGHNFGIVTQIKMRIYDRAEETDQWAADGFVYTEDKMEAVFALANEWLGSETRPKEMIHYGIFAFNSELDAEKPLVILWVFYNGPSIPTQFTDPLNALKPIAVDRSVTDLAGVNTHLMATVDGVSCAKGFSRLMYPVSLDTWSLPALRKVLNSFAAVPASYRNSVIMLEAYSTNRVAEVPSDSIAFPDRASQLLVSPVLTYPANASLDAEAFKFGEEMRAALLDAAQSKLNAYVNYARGDESLEAVYGYEQWRLERLRKLKREYDPEGKFNFFAPIV